MALSVKGSVGETMIQRLNRAISNVRGIEAQLARTRRRRLDKRTWALSANRRVPVRAAPSLYWEPWASASFQRRSLKTTRAFTPRLLRPSGSATRLDGTLKCVCFGVLALSGDEIHNGFSIHHIVPIIYH